MGKEGLKSRTEDEDDLATFNMLLPIYMSIEQKYFNLREACKSSQYFCINHATGLRKETLFWDKDSTHTCGGVGCNAGKSTKCRHIDVDNNQELEKNSTELRGLLEDNDWVVGAKVDHIEERLRGRSDIRCDPGVVSKEIE